MPMQLSQLLLFPLPLLNCFQKHPSLILLN